uniref:uncharacterized protein LOC120333633 isoform X2 n=1 Tax=Styela clava TaxID=7725 RepID=UPI0019399CDB|nr:uncharacterized protein LOC120333633 isoform X2 [Styela clava]
MIYFIGSIILSFLCGALTIVFVALYFVYKYRQDLFQLGKKPRVEYEKSHLGTLLHHNLNNGGGSSILGEKETCRFVNVLFAFIFREWRDTNQLQKWVLKKINIEFMEFMETKTASRLLQGLKIHDVSLGSNFPVFHSAKIKEPYSFTGDELPETVVLELDMEYHGGFYLAIDVDLVFGRTAFLAVRITYLKGRIRLHFSRQPCTHWSLSFMEEPDIKFDVETSFETRQLPQLQSLIVNQIRRTIRRKHTLPHYKMRYNPFFSFQHPDQSPFDGFISEIPTQPSSLEVCVAAATRLLISSRGEKERNAEAPNYVVFVTISVNVETCIGKALLSLISTPNAVLKPEIPDVIPNNSSLVETPSTSRTQPVTKTPNTTFDTIQRSFLGLRKDITSSAERSKKPQPAVSQPQVPEKVDQPPAIEKDTLPVAKIQRKDSESSSSSSSSGPSYVMVALNFGATLREENQEDGQKIVVVENITEHNDGQSGMKDGDTVIELNSVPITSLSQAITTIELIRAKKESFKFKVRRNRIELDKSSLSQNNPAADSDKSNTSMDTESDHSDVDLEDFQDFVNISLQVAELHMKDGSGDRRTSSMSEKGPHSSTNQARPHSSSVDGNLDTNADAPYMTLVSSPSPSTSLKSLKYNGSGDKASPPKNTEKDSSNKKVEIKKEKPPRSRSESPPFFRRSHTTPKQEKSTRQTLTGAQTSTGSGKADKTKKESPVKRNPSPARNSSSNRQPEMFQEIFKTPSRPDKSAEVVSPPSISPLPRTTENLSYARVDDELDSQLFKTSHVNSNQHEYSWNNEKFQFNLKERHRYLNIRYWTQQIGKQGIIKTKPPQIVGCVSIPLCELEMNCRGVTSRRVTRRFPLFAPNELPHDHKWFLGEPVASRSSFREQYCYGDTTLTVKLEPKPGNKNNSSNHNPHSHDHNDDAGSYFPDDDTNGMLTTEMLNKMSERSGSDYLLSSNQQQGRRLLVSKETQTPDKEQSSPKKSTQNKTNESTDQSETVEDDKEIHETTKVPVHEKSSLSQILRGFLHGHKANTNENKKNANDLPADPEIAEDPDSQESLKPDDVIVGVITNDKSGLHQFEAVKLTKSMKCSFCHNKLWTKSGLQCTICSSVCHKRCVEKYKKDAPCIDSTENENVETKLVDKSSDRFVVVDSDDNSEKGLPTKALSFRNKILDMTMSPESKDVNSNVENSGMRVPGSRPRTFSRTKESEHLLAVNAKQMGRDLHRDLPLSQRKAMLESQTQKVENELHSEIEEKERLIQEQKQAGNTTPQWDKLNKKILKSDERLQALALLLLHYRAGLEDCEFDSTTHGLVLSDDEDEIFGQVSSHNIPEVRIENATEDEAINDNM